jgi:plastocyanin
MIALLTTSAIAKQDLKLNTKTSLNNNQDFLDLFFGQPYKHLYEQKINFHAQKEIPTKQVEATKTKVHIVEVINKGFNPEKIEIKSGETIEWQNKRASLRLNKMLIVGTPLCGHFKSKVLSTDQSYSWTFEKPNRCVVVDSVTKYVMVVNVK